MLGYKDIPSASDGLQGFEMAEKTHYDLVLMDLQMPVMDGFTALTRIKESPLTGQPCVVALTANADMVSPLSDYCTCTSSDKLQATQDRCEAAGFFTYLSKPLNIGRFEQTLKSVYQHRQNQDNETNPDQLLIHSVRQKPTSVNSSKDIHEEH